MPQRYAIIVSMIKLYFRFFDKINCNCVGNILSAWTAKENTGLHENRIYQFNDFFPLCDLTIHPVEINCWAASTTYCYTRIWKMRFQFTIIFLQFFFLLFLLSVPFSSLGTASRAHTHTIMETTNWFDLNKWNLNEKTTSFLLVLNAFVRMRSSVRADHGNWLIAGDPYYARLHSQNYQTCQCLKEQLKLQL